MSFFAGIGIVVSAVFGLLALAILWVIAGNIYGGIKGAYRLHAIRVRSGRKKSAHWQIIIYGLRHSRGERYRDGFGTYYQIGGMKVPVDGRDEIDRDRFYGA